MDSIELIKNKFQARILKLDIKSPRRVYIDLDPKDIKEAITYLFKDLDLRYMVVTGIDTRFGMELLYHFAEDSEGRVFSVRIILDKKNKLEIESMTPIIRGISWIEREIHELLGVNFTGHPNLKHLLLADDWPEGNYPLRQDQNRDQDK